MALVHCAANIRSLNHLLLILSELHLLVAIVIAELQDVRVVIRGCLVGSDAEFLIESVCEVAFALPVALLLQGRLDVNFKFLGVAPRTALVFHDLARYLHDRVLSFRVSARRTGVLLL